MRGILSNALEKQDVANDTKSNYYKIGAFNFETNDGVVSRVRYID